MKRMIFTLKSGKTIVQTVSEQDSDSIIEKYLTTKPSSEMVCLIIQKKKNDIIVESAYFNKDEIAAIQIESDTGGYNK